MTFRDPGWVEWVGAGMAVYVFTALLRVLGWSLGASLLLVAGPVAGYVLAMLLVGHFWLRGAEWMRSVSGLLLAGYFATLLGVSLHQLAELHGWY